MRLLDTLPRDAVQPLPASVEVLRAEAGEHWVRIPLHNVVHRQAQLQVIAEALEFPKHFGHNLDALHDCLGDLPSDRMLWLEGLRQDAQTRALLAVFRDAAAEFAAAGRSLRVFY